MLRPVTSTAKLNALRLLCLMVPWLCSGTVFALPSDQQQPIRISADSAMRDEQAGETRYEGNVVLIQGSLRITAEQLTLEHADETTNLIVATGNPATLEQTPELDSQPVRAQANTIEYRRSADRITLITNARIEQDGAVVMGAVIDYQITDQRVTASSGDAAIDDNKRVEMIIPPSAIERPESQAN